MYRIGQSTDIHVLCEGRDLILGGVKIEHELGLLGHSDADVLTHAITEAIIGALGMGDLGTFFPDTSKEFKDIDSLILLDKVNKVMIDNDYEIVNIDSIIMIQRPKMITHISKMKDNLANILNIDPKNINIKATTGEKVGIIGKEEAALAQAVVLIRKV